MLIVEELFLLLTSDSGKSVAMGTNRAVGLTAALVMDLVMAERVRLGPEKDARVYALDASPTGHPALDAALERVLAKNGRRLSATLMDGKISPLKNTGRALAEAGVVNHEEKSFLGFTRPVYSTRDAEPGQAVRERLTASLQGGPATVPDATLLSVLQALGVAFRVLKAEALAAGLDKKTLKRRIDAVAADCPAGAAVNAAMATIAAMMVVVTASAAAAAQ